MRIRIHKNQPGAGGRRRAAVSRAGNLVDRLENHRCGRRARIFRRPVGGIVVADNQFKIQPRCVNAPAANLILRSDPPSNALR